MRRPESGLFPHIIIFQYEGEWFDRYFETMAYRKPDAIIQRRHWDGHQWKEDGEFKVYRNPDVEDYQWASALAALQGYTHYDGTPLDGLAAERRFATGTHPLQPGETAGGVNLGDASLSSGGD